MDATQMTAGETDTQTGGQASGQPTQTVAEALSAACVQATGRAMAHMTQTMKAMGHAPAGVPPSTEDNA